MTTKNELQELPNGWVWTTLGDIRFENSKTILPYKYPDELFELYSVPSFDTQRPEIVYGKVIGSNKQTVEEDTVLLCKINPRINRVWIVGNYSHYTKIASTEWIPFTTLEGIYTKYLQHFMQNKEFRDFLTLNVSGVGGSLMRVNSNTFAKYLLPLPPLPEQHRIVAKIEELFTRLDAGVDALNKIKLQLKRYRQSVLKAAFEGRLTEEWRAANKDKLEPASVLLEQIKAKREKSLVAKYKELPLLDTTELPELPEGWVWTTIQNLTENNRNAIKAGPFGSSLKKECYVTEGYKIYGQEQVLRGDPFYGDYYINKEKYEELKSCSIKSGDTLISLVGTIGKILILPEGIKPGIINPRLVKISFDNRIISNKYFKAYMESSYINQTLLLTSHGGTMEILNLSILKDLPIPLSPIFEQEAIIREIERCFSIAAQIETVIEQSLKQADRLRQSILKQAFEGKLVPQDPTDEPAEKLLERIKAERAKQVIRTTRGGTRK